MASFIPLDQSDIETIIDDRKEHPLVRENYLGARRVRFQFPNGLLGECWMAEFFEDQNSAFIWADSKGIWYTTGWFKLDGDESELVCRPLLATDEQVTFAIPHSTVDKAMELLDRFKEKNLGSRAFLVNEVLPVLGFLAFVAFLVWLTI